MIVQEAPHQRIARAFDAAGVDIGVVDLAVLDLAAELMRCSQTGLWILEAGPNGRRMRLLAGWDGDARRPLQLPQVLQEHEFGAYFDALFAHGVFVSRDALADPVLASMRDNYLMPHDVRALLDVAVSVNGGAQAVLCCELRGATRDWQGSDIALARRIATEIAVRRARALGGG